MNTLVVRDGRIEGHSTDTAILDGLPAQRRRSSAAGGSAAAFRAALPHARVFSRRGSWPPDVAEADLVVNATSERDEVVATVGEGQTLIDLPYPETATGRAAREAGARSSPGWRCSSRRAPPRSSSGRGSPHPSRSCARP